MVKEQYLINEAAKEVHVEPHVLRYWEEELDLPIGRNEQGHRIYTNTDIEKLIRVKSLKEQGLQLKAVKALVEEPNPNSKEIRIVPMKSDEEQSRRFQYLFQKLIKEAVAANNEEMASLLTSRISENIKNDMAKELDYQLRMSEERSETRQETRNEEHYKQIDTLLRKYSAKAVKEKQRDKTIKFPDAKQGAKQSAKMKKSKKEISIFKKTKKNAAP